MKRFRDYFFLFWRCLFCPPSPCPLPPQGGEERMHGIYLKREIWLLSSPPFGGEVADERCEEAGEGVSTRQSLSTNTPLFAAMTNHVLVALSHPP